MLEYLITFLWSLTVEQECQQTKANISYLFFFLLVYFGGLCLKPIREFGPGRLCPADCEASPKELTLTHPRSPCFPAETLECPPPPYHHHHPKFSIISPSLPPQIMKPKPSTIYRRSSSSGPLQLIVPETTDENCERKHINSAELWKGVEAFRKSEG